MITGEIVAERLKEAVIVLENLRVAVGPAGFKSSWPTVVRSSSDAYGWSQASSRPPPPQGAEIDRMDEALSWLHLVDDDLSKLIWARLNGAPWWRICQRFRKSERHLRDKMLDGYEKIARLLNRASVAKTELPATTNIRAGRES